MKKFGKKGFTLIELIVVIAIIGVLAGILVPSLMGYIKKAKKNADIAAASTIAKAVGTVLAEDDEAYESFYKYNTTKFDVVSNGEFYKLVVVSTIDGRSNKRGAPKYKEWKQGNNESKGFVDAINYEMNIENPKPGKFLCPMKYGGTDKKPINVWAICYRENDKDKLEIWACDGNVTGGHGCYPRYRMWPTLDNTY